MELHDKIPKKLDMLKLDDKFRFIELGTDIISREIGVINKKTDSIELKIYLPSDYPFKPPTVYVSEVGETNTRKIVGLSESTIHSSVRMDGLSRLTISPVPNVSFVGGMGVSGATVVTPTHTKYDRWSTNIIQRQKGLRPLIKRLTNDELFYAWAFSIIRRPELLLYWSGIIPTRDDCLCCESLICGKNWNPSIIMCDVLGEYVTRRDFKINCGKVMQRLIHRIFNNDRWVIPDEIIMLIINKGVSPL
jgi:hypothetical protein